MSTAKNKRLIRDLYAELNNGNTQPFFERMADDIRWTVIGTTKFSGTIIGKQNVINKLVSPLESQLDGPTIATIKNVLAESDYVVVESIGKATTKGGQPYHNSYCEIYRLSNGKIQEVTIYLDTALIEAVLG